MAQLPCVSLLVCLLAAALAVAGCDLQASTVGRWCGETSAAIQDASCDKSGCFAMASDAALCDVANASMSGTQRELIAALDSFGRRCSLCNATVDLQAAEACGMPTLAHGDRLAPTCDRRCVAQLRTVLSCSGDIEQSGGSFVQVERATSNAQPSLLRCAAPASAASSGLPSIVVYAGAAILVSLLLSCVCWLYLQRLQKQAAEEAMGAGKRAATRRASIIQVRGRELELATAPSHQPVFDLHRAPSPSLAFHAPHGQAVAVIPISHRTSSSDVGDPYLHDGIIMVPAYSRSGSTASDAGAMAAAGWAADDSVPPVLSREPSAVGS